MSTSAARDTRMGALASALTRHGRSAYFCTSGVTMNYLAGFQEEGGERLLTLVVGADGKNCLIAPALTRNQAERSGLQDVRVWSDGEDPIGLVKGLLDEWGCADGAFSVDDEMRSSLLLALQSALPQATFTAGHGLLGELTRIKDPGEIAKLKKAGDIADSSLADVLSKVKPGTTEWAVNELLGAEMSRRGGVPVFAIVATGAHGAEPHHHTGQTAVAEGDVVVLDYGCQYEGYLSDITRTVVVGRPTAEQSQVYRIVYDAHMAAREAIRPGVAAEDVDRAARRVIDDAGYGEFFVHRTGHGLGMRVHEEPYICKGNSHALEVGNVFSIEPGIYLPGRFGVRIENIVAVTDDGHESMNAEPTADITVVPVS
ncbi:MAG: aminopeptidase P family protein [Armatimonadetes bacterium]|nr:aminopeptidase P family protein [Armatimonadota bacterium]